MGNVGLCGCRYVLEGVPPLLTAAFDHRQHRLREATPAGTLRPKRQLPPNHGVP